MLVYKIDVIEALKDAGYNSTRIRKEHIFSEGTMTDIRKGKVVSANVLDKLCELLEMQPCHIIKYVSSDNKNV